MYVNLPFTQVWVKQSFLTADFLYTKDPHMLEAYLVGVRLTSYQPPLFEVFIPKYNACYDKVMQNGIFDKAESPDKKIGLDYVAWWDCISSEARAYKKHMLTNCDVTMVNRKGDTLGGSYEFTLDFHPPRDPQAIHASESIFWSEHKQKNFFFEEKLGVLCCGPNNKVRWLHSSLATEKPDRPPFKVFSPPREFSHEGTMLLGDTDQFDYYQS